MRSFLKKKALAWFKATGCNNFLALGRIKPMVDGTRVVNIWQHWMKVMFFYIMFLFSSCFEINLTFPERQKSKQQNSHHPLRREDEIYHSKMYTFTQQIEKIHHAFKWATHSHTVRRELSSMSERLVSG